MTHGRVGILGGTLDPVHEGHLQAARLAWRTINLERVLLMPSHVPPHRAQQPLASPFHRFAMAAIAAASEPWLAASDLELLAPGPTYTADTLERLHRAGLSGPRIFFIIGADAFAEIDTWSRYPGVLNMAHFVVISRPGLAASDLPARLPALASRMRAADGAGAEAPDTAIHLVDGATPDVSSTGIRDRRLRGAPIDGLVPPGVAAHILRHGLYSASQPLHPALTTADHLHGQD